MSSGSVIILARQAVELTRPVPCRDGDPRLWFAEDPEDLELAKAHCRTCPLRAACLAGAIERREPCGVWGGEIFDRGRILAVKRRRGRPHTDRAARGAGATGPARKAASARKAMPVRKGTSVQKAAPAWTDVPTGKDRAPLGEICG
jgi:WhiB family redox-sensing transcriptional regulator